LADFYGRPFLELFLSDPPTLTEPKLVPDFRLYPRVEGPEENRVLKNIQLWAEAQRSNALDLYEELSDSPTKIDPQLFVTIESNAEDVASTAREAISFPIEDQVGRRQNERGLVPQMIRDRIEGLGILALRVSNLKQYGVRGFCMVDDPLPIIIFGKESPNAQAFTLCHELAHIFIRQSAISGFIPREGGDNKKRRVEEWCDGFAAAFLMPATAVARRVENVPLPNKTISDESLLGLAEYFAVSRHAMCIRLMHLGMVSPRFYWEVKKPQFDEEERRYRSFGRAKYYGRRFIGSLGKLYTSLVIDALNTGRITNHHAAEFMGTTFTHLRDIRENFGR
jgi:Zn-dependent peptidase ImmA (M78 family)